MASDRLRRGRPPTFTAESRRELADLIRQHGARGTRELAPVPISLATLLKIAQEFGIALPKGRRRKSEVIPFRIVPALQSTDDLAA